MDRHTHPVPNRPPGRADRGHPSREGISDVADACVGATLAVALMLRLQPDNLAGEVKPRPYEEYDGQEKPT